MADITKHVAIVLDTKRGSSPAAAGTPGTVPSQAAQRSLVDALKDMLFGARKKDAEGKDTGPRGGGLKDSFTEVTSRLREGISSLVSAASPEAFGTFQKSLTMLAASLGQSLIPLTIKASKYIQDLSWMILELDPSTKKAIAGTLALGGGLVALSAAAQVARPLIGLVTAIGNLSIARSAAAGVGSLVARLGLLGGAIAGLAAITGMAAFKLLSQQRDAKRAKEGQLNRADFAGHEDLLEGDRDTAIKEAMKRRDEANKEATEAKEKIGGFASETAARAFESVIPGGGSNREDLEKYDKAVAEREKLDRLIRTLQQGAKPSDIAKELDKAGGVGAANKSGHNLLYDRKVQPVSYRGIEDIRKGAQLASLGGSPFDRMLQQMQKQGDFESRTAAASEQTERNTRKTANAPPPVGP